MISGTKASYKKLPGSGRKKGFLQFIGGTCTLWLSDNHLLEVESNGVIENYRRFYFNDIQAVIITKTMRHLIINAIFVLLLALSAGALISGNVIPSDTFLFASSWAMAVFSLLCLIANLYKGSGCTFRIITAVQDEIIPSIKRQRTALNILRIIRNSCEKEQGILPRQDILTKEIPERISGGNKKTLHEFNRKYHIMMFLIVLIQGVLLGLDMINHLIAYNYIQGFLGTLASIVIIMAIYKQQGSNAPAYTKNLTWATVVFIFLSFTISFVAIIPSIMPEAGATQYDMYKEMLKVSPNDSQAIFWCYMISFVGYICLGAAGLFNMLFSFPDKRNRGTMF